MTRLSSGMNCSLEKVLADAKSLVERLRNHDNAAEMLIEQTTSLNKRVEAMKQVGHECVAGWVWTEVVNAVSGWKHLIHDGVHSEKRPNSVTFI